SSPGHDSDFRRRFPRRSCFSSSAPRAIQNPLMLLSPILAEGLNYLEVITHAGAVELSVLGLLLGASVASCAIILRKVSHLRTAQRDSAVCLESFWQSRRLDAIFEGAEKMARSPVCQVFRAGYIELSKLTTQPQGSEGAMSERLGGIENVERALHRAQVAEL